MPYIQICGFYLFFEHHFIGLALKINGQKMGSLYHIYVSNYGSKIFGSRIQFTTKCRFIFFVNSLIIDLIKESLIIPIPRFNFFFWFSEWLYSWISMLRFCIWDRSLRVIIDLNVTLFTLFITTNTPINQQSALF